MKTKKELEQDIINITTTILQKFPELSKNISEMPGNSSENAEVTVKYLDEYLNSLQELLNSYAKTHDALVTNKSMDVPPSPWYPIYPPSEDNSKRRGSTIEKDFKDDKSGYDLNVPGPELDDDQESIGGDNHNDLDKD